jgi:hypothetical protein
LEHGEHGEHGEGAGNRSIDMFIEMGLVGLARIGLKSAKDLLHIIAA